MILVLFLLAIGAVIGSLLHSAWIRKHVDEALLAAMIAFIVIAVMSRGLL